MLFIFGAAKYHYGAVKCDLKLLRDFPFSQSSRLTRIHF